MAATKCEVMILEGQELRDEFTCPITRSLMRVPVIAADGHTYERSAIERWLIHCETAPRTGEKLNHRMLVPNHNLKRLIDDLVLEGGAGLYAKVGANEAQVEARRWRELVSEPLLLFQCLGPVESEWCGLSFEVFRTGVTGGRRAPHQNQRRGDQRDFMPFLDSAVSRRHFDIDRANDRFAISDLGSASGTFRRLRTGAAFKLRPGDMTMIGKHQLLVREPGPSDQGENDDDDDVVLLVLDCFAPDKSPLQGRSFPIGPRGATIGRQPSNLIRFATEVEGESMCVDSSVSAEHARVVYDERSRTFDLLDGSADGKPSTNGTWIRLSAMHTPSDPFDLESGDEILIGSVRFHVTVTNTFVENDADNDAKC